MGDLSGIKDQVIVTVREAGDLLLSYYGHEIDSRSKGRLDFATEADDAIDKFLRKELSKKFSGTKFLTEETALSDYLSLKEEENLWVIDPIDGTTNFSRGLEPFCISVGLVSYGQPTLGVIYEPTKNNLYHTSLDDEYAFCNEDKLRVSETKELEEAYVVTGLPWGDGKRQEVYKLIDKVYLNVRAMGIRGSAAQDLCELSKGTIDGFFIMGIKPWDVAAGAVLLQKAGGKMVSLGKEQWNVFESDVIFSNRNLYEKLLETLR